MSFCPTSYNIFCEARKRKFPNELPIETRPLKMHITEEKMVSQLNSIHLSNCYTTHGASTIPIEPFPDDQEVAIKPSLVTTTSNTLPVLQFSEELKALGNFSMNPVIPDTFINKFNSKPTNALVLWQPPVVGSIARSLPCKQTSAPEEIPPEEENQPPPVLDVEMNDFANNNNNNFL